MARIFPFRAVRPLPEQAPAVASVPYDVVNREEAHALASRSPVSFLHVTRAEIDLPPETDPYSDAVYRTAAETFRGFRAGGPLVQDATPGLYVYRLERGSHEQTGLAACFDLDDYVNGAIVKHERTRRDKEDDRTRHILGVGAQTGPVFLTYPATAEIDALIGRTASGVPLADFVAEDGVSHAIWRVPQEDVEPVTRAFGAISRVYIADGHHRAASALRARDAIRARRPGAGELEADRFLAVAFPHTQTQILPYHRAVKDLNGRTTAEFLSALRERCRVQAGGETPQSAGRVAMCLEGQWYDVELPPALPSPSAADRLDVARLQQHVLEPLLDIDDPRTNRRIEFVGGIRGPAELRRLVESGAAAVAFAMYPVGVAELMEIADSSGIMPPKSTWFEPKLRDGLLTHLIEQDPD